MISLAIYGLYATVSLFLSISTKSTCACYNNAFKIKKRTAYVGVNITFYIWNLNDQNFPTRLIRIQFIKCWYKVSQSCHTRRGEASGGVGGGGSLLAATHRSPRISSRAYANSVFCLRFCLLLYQIHNKRPTPVCIILWLFFYSNKGFLTLFLLFCKGFICLKTP